MFITIGWLFIGVVSIEKYKFDKSHFYIKVENNKIHVNSMLNIRIINIDGDLVINETKNKILLFIKDKKFKLHVWGIIKMIDWP